MKKLSVLALAAVMSASAFAAKVGVVNSQELFYKYSKTKVIEENLKKQGASLDNTLNQKQVELKKLQLELQAKGTKVTDSEKKAFEDKAKALDKFVRDAQMKLEKERNTRLQEVENTMKNAIDKVAKADKYDYVFEAGAVRFGGTDITAKVLQEMEKTK
ncbi:OmpH family outer membrane protein [Fusobacterium sp.]|uniref:OmpH family outer membrane protein n=1 Tax=Fusobacterium sp. TaxID=68766 RepID=UPI0026377E59|nr:OmpH family outer membrane protein [Fusobacterium sp.]